MKFIIYTSKATENMTSKDISDILLKARRNNQSMGITGALFYKDGMFLQILEGFDEIIDGLVATISEDNRHNDFKILFEGAKDNSDFTDWSMGEIPIDSIELAPSILSNINKDKIDLATAQKIIDEAKAICSN